MGDKHLAMHVAKIVNRQRNKAGEEKVYESYLLRSNYREGGKVKHKTIANITHMPPRARDALTAALKGEELLPVSNLETDITRSLPHGDTAAVLAMAKKLGLPALLGPKSQARNIIMGLIVSRILNPDSKAATLDGWRDTTMGQDLGLEDITTDEVYRAMDELHARWEKIEKSLVAKHLVDPINNPHRLAMFDLTSTWVEGTHCELAARGYSRDKRKGSLQIEFGLLTSPGGVPVGLRVFKGNTADPSAFSEVLSSVKEDLKLDNLVMVGDRGMITSTRVNDIKKLGGMGWISALKSGAIRKLAEDEESLQLSLFDETDLAEFASPLFPGERLIACRNPDLAAKRAGVRSDLLAATEASLDKIVASVRAGRLKDADKIGLRVGRVIDKFKMAKHFELAIEESSLSYSRKTEQIDAEAALDGIYIIRTSLNETQMGPAQVVHSYKQLANVERDFRIIKADDLQVRPIWHRRSDRVEAHLLICFLAAYVTYHLRHAWAPLTFKDQAPPARSNPVAKAVRSAQAEVKAASRKNSDGERVTSFRVLLKHLGTLTRNSVTYLGLENEPTYEVLTRPTALQRQAFDLIGADIVSKISV